MDQDTEKHNANGVDSDVPSVAQRQKLIETRAVQNREYAMNILRRIAGEKVAQEYEVKTASEIVRPLSLVSVDELNSTGAILECINHHLNRIHG